MRLLLQLALVGVLLIGGSAPRAAADVIVSAGYLNNQGGPPNPADVPNPFNSSATTTLISSGGVSASHDTGVLLFQNTGSTAVVINPGVKVQTQGGTFELWDGSLPFTLGPGKNLVLAETANFDFDLSDSGLTLDPLVSGSVNGVPFAFTDTARTLLGRDDIHESQETSPYHQLGTIAIGIAADPVPEPGTLALFGAGLGGLLLVAARRRRNRVRREG
jgi:hypothetical protein